MALVPSLWLLFVPAVVFGVAQGINIPNVFSLLNSIAPSENRGAFMATISASLGLAGAYLAASALAAATFVLLLTLLR